MKSKCKLCVETSDYILPIELETFKLITESKWFRLHSIVNFPKIQKLNNQNHDKFKIPFCHKLGFGFSDAFSLHFDVNGEGKKRSKPENIQKANVVESASEKSKQILTMFLCQKICNAIEFENLIPWNWFNASELMRLAFRKQRLQFRSIDWYLLFGFIVDLLPWYCVVLVLVLVLYVFVADYLR